jgi:hypothetical protein
MGLMLTLVGCQSLAERKQSSRLEDVLRKYEGVIRWGTIDQASRFYRPAEMEGMVSKPAGEMRVTHYEVVQGPTLVEDNKAIQTAVIQFVFVESQIVRELIDQQTWEYEPEEERWYLTSPAPIFK